MKKKNHTIISLFGLKQVCRKTCMKITISKHQKCIPWQPQFQISHNDLTLFLFLTFTHLDDGDAALWDEKSSEKMLLRKTLAHTDKHKYTGRETQIKRLPMHTYLWINRSTSQLNVCAVTDWRYGPMEGWGGEETLSRRMWGWGGGGRF